MSRVRTKANSGDVDMPVIDEVFVTVEETKQRHVHIHINEYFTEPSYYAKLQPILSDLNESDVVLWHLNSLGGRLSTALVVYHWMMQTEAHNIALIEGDNASATTFLIMGADSVIAFPHSCVMFHGATYGTWDTMNKTREYVEFQDKRFRAMMGDVYQDFFTEEEIENMINSSSDIWMSGEEVVQRLMKREEKQQALLLNEKDDLDEVIENVKKAHIKPDVKPKPRKTKTEK